MLLRTLVDGGCSIPSVTAWKIRGPAMPNARFAAFGTWKHCSALGLRLRRSGISIIPRLLRLLVFSGYLFVQRALGCYEFLADRIKLSSRFQKNKGCKIESQSKPSLHQQ